jgi:hemolysin activation/secretion protein
VWPLPQTWVVHSEYNVTKNLDPENQLILGGNTGLRGYKNDSFTGTRSALLNIEDRVFLVHEFLHLFYMGGAAFFEIGAISPFGGGINRDLFKSDAGIGLRLSPTRSTSGNIVRLDVAYALNSGPGPSRWVIGIRGGQAFNIFNSTNQEVLNTPATAISSNSNGATLRRQ